MKHFIIMNLACIVFFGVVPTLPFMLISHLTGVEQAN